MRREERKIVQEFALMATFIDSAQSRSDVLPSTASIAVLDEVHERRASLQRSLAQMGHRAIAFQSATELLTALVKGERFDLLLLTIQDELTSRSLATVCDELSLPTLLMMDYAQWESMSPAQAEISTRGDAIKPGPAGLAVVELEWRVRTLLLRQRSHQTNLPQDSKGTTWGGYRFLSDSRTVLLHGQTICLQPFQYAIALELFRGVGKILPREVIWERAGRITPMRRGSRVIDASVARLRTLLKLGRENGFILHSVYGHGYQLMPVELSAGNQESH
jgi:DNA-binding response OmpR family regulator